ncbi:MAG: AAA family ATPase [Cyanobacteria bacterium J06555_13]
MTPVSSLPSSLASNVETQPPTTQPPISQSSISQIPWFEANRLQFIAQVNHIRQVLEKKVTQSPSASFTPSTSTDDSELIWETESLSPPSVLDVLCKRFELSLFERQILLLCAGAELSQTFGALFAALHGDPQKTYPTFGLAFSLFPEGDWAAVLPGAPLRRWQMVEILPGTELTRSPLRIDEHILHRLMGFEGADSRLKGIVSNDLSATSVALPDSHQDIADSIAVGSFSRANHKSVVQLWGGEEQTKQAIALNAAAQNGLSLHRINANALPTDRTKVEKLQTLWERDSILAQSALLLACDQLSEVTSHEESQLKMTVADVIDNEQRPLMVSSCDRLTQHQRPLQSIELHSPTPWEQRQLWQTHLRDIVDPLSNDTEPLIDQLITYFNLDVPGIQAVCKQINTPKGQHNLQQNSLPESTQLPTEALKTKLWQTCLSQARPKLGELAQLMPSSANWDDLVLPDPELQVLKTIAAHVQQRATVYERWGFAERSSRGLGISALFAGASGTGKTLAAETLANKLNLDLYRIDLSMVVSKYIGETEKNLRRIFDGAEKGGAILLFDEADALFGKRSDVKDARDRYANMEVAYLLQRIEAYRGLAILTTNLKDSLDQAFLRRIRFVVQFPFPDATQREKIWRCSFPEQVPLGNLKFKTLAKLNLAGGNIRNIVLNSAFLAADEGKDAVEMGHVLKAAQSEYIKLERPLTELRDRDIQQWMG